MLCAVIVLEIYWSHEHHVFTLTTAAGKVTALLKHVSTRSTGICYPAVFNGRLLLQTYSV